MQVLQRYFSGGWFGEDRDGHPVWYEDNHIDWQGEGREEGGGGEGRGEGRGHRGLMFPIRVSVTLL